MLEGKSGGLNGDMAIYYFDVEKGSKPKLLTKFNFHDRSAKFEERD